jgi:hypothetical protein
MIKSRTMTWLVRVLGGSAIAAAVVFGVAGEASALKRLNVLFGLSNTDCRYTPAGAEYVGRAIGWSSSGVAVCDITASGSTATMYCPNAARIQAYINYMDSNNAFGGGRNCGADVNWPGSQGCSYSIPVTSACPAGATASVSIWGEN